MKDHKPDGKDTLPVAEESGYESPRVESVLTPEEMEREILYAGNGGTQFG